MNAPKAIQYYIRVSDTNLMQNYTTLRAGIFRFLTRGRAFGQEGQLQGVPMELYAVAAVARPTKAGKGKGSGPTTKPSGRREVE
eukprot:1683798-Heterocapsa_arctica.AAC.1